MQTAAENPRHLIEGHRHVGGIRLAKEGHQGEQQPPHRPHENSWSLVAPPEGILFIFA